MNLVYLAAPYSHPNKSIVAGRIEAFCIIDAELCKQGIFTVSPLLKHLVLQHSDLPSDWNYWKDYSEVLLSKCERMVIITLDGWKESIGVQAEIELCKKYGVPIDYLDPVNFLI